MGVYWAGIETRVTREIDLCPCNKLIQNRSKHPALIPMKESYLNPLERLQADIAFISKEAGPNQEQVILNVKDHFSKYSWSGFVPKLFHFDNCYGFKVKITLLLQEFGIKELQVGRIIIHLK
jgi:hypothetical protein